MLCVKVDINYSKVSETGNKVIIFYIFILYFLHLIQLVLIPLLYALEIKLGKGKNHKKIVIPALEVSYSTTVFCWNKIISILPKDLYTEIVFPVIASKTLA